MEYDLVADPLLDETFSSKKPGSTGQAISLT
jgi:hypothetical protein